MRSHPPRHPPHQGRVLRAPSGRLPRAHPVSRGPDRAHRQRSPARGVGGLVALRVTVTGEAPVELAPVRAAVRAALRPYGLPTDTAVAVAFVDDPTMRD